MCPNPDGSPTADEIAALNAAPSPPPAYSPEEMAAMQSGGGYAVPGAPPPSFGSKPSGAGGVQVPSMMQNRGGAPDLSFDGGMTTAGVYDRPNAPPPLPSATGQAGAPAGVPDFMTNPNQYVGGASVPQAQPQGPHMVGGGWNKQFNPFRPKTMENEEKALQGHEEAATGLTNALAKQQEDIANIYRTQADDAAARLQVQQEKENARQEQYSQAMSKYQTAVDDAANGKVDPNRYMANRSTGDRVLGALSAGLVGMADARDGKPNSALERIERNIDRDIRAQEQDLSTKKWKAGAQMSMLGELRAQGMDARSASNAVEAAQWRIAEERLKSLVANSTSEVQRQNGKEMLAQIQDRRVGIQQRTDQYEFQRPHMVGGTPQLSKDEMGNIFMGADGQRYIARNAESRKKAVDSNVTYQNVQSSLNDYSAALKDITAADRLAAKSGYTTDAMSKATTAYNHALSYMRQAQDDGVWKKSEVEMLAGTLTPPDHFSGNPGAQIELAQKQASKVNQNTMRSEDAVPVQAGFAVNPATGQLQNAAALTGQLQQPPKNGPMPGTKIGP